MKTSVSHEVMINKCSKLNGLEIIYFIKGQDQLNGGRLVFVTSFLHDN